MILRAFNRFRSPLDALEFALFLPGTAPEVSRDTPDSTDRRTSEEPYTHWHEPRFEVVDQGDALRLTAVVPGVLESDLELELQQDRLTIRGERKARPIDGFTVRKRERRDYSINRSLRLPAKVAADRVEATLSNGILTVVLPKAQAEKPQKITVRTS